MSALLALSAPLQALAAAPVEHSAAEQQAAIALINTAVSERVGHRVDLSAAKAGAMGSGPGAGAIVTALVLGGLAGLLITKAVYPHLKVKSALRPSRVTVSRDGWVAGVAFRSGLITLWDLRRGREIGRWNSGLTDPVAFAVPDSGAFAVVAVGDGVHRLDAAGDKRLLTTPSVRALALSADGARLAVGADDGSAAIVGAGTGERLARVSFARKPVALWLGPDAEEVVALSPEGALIRPGEAVAAKRAGPILSGQIDETGRGAWALRADGSLLGVSRPVPAHLSLAGSGLAIAGDGKAVLNPAPQEVEILSMASGARAGRLVTTPQGWAVLDFEGRFDGNQGGVAAVAWEAKEATFGLASLAEAYFEPGVLSKLVSAKAGGATDTLPAVERGVKPPPAVTLVTAPESAARAGAAQLVVVLAEDRGGGVEAARLFHNGKVVDPGALVQSREVRIGDHALVASAFLTTPTPGVNTFLGTAKNTAGAQGTSARLTRIVSGMRRPGVLYVLSVGVNAYAPPLPRLAAARGDAEAIGRALSNAVPAFARIEHLELTDAAATRRQVLERLRDVSARTEPGDTLVIFLAGHGFALSRTEWVFGLADTDASSAEAAQRTGLLASELRDILVSAKAQKIVLAIDACQSGTAVSPFRDQRSFYLKLLNDVSRSTGLIVYAATEETSSALEVPALGHGLFTYAFLAALEDGARASPTGSVTAFQVADSVERDVPTLALAQRNFTQDAVTFRLGDDFPLR
jgi:hypothetical protein